MFLQYHYKITISKVTLSKTPIRCFERLQNNESLFFSVSCIKKRDMVFQNAVKGRNEASKGLFYVVNVLFLQCEQSQQLTRLCLPKQLTDIGMNAMNMVIYNLKLHNIT